MMNAMIFAFWKFVKTHPRRKKFHPKSEKNYDHDDHNDHDDHDDHDSRDDHGDHDEHDDTKRESGKQVKVKVENK